ncbi:TPA: TetR/AcrR family transcriptional regulator, partial [Acinetobacter baumannii]|nr:TetR/AcrR family transcriptional regulator [Acinetobacter baumannii]
VVVEPLDPAQNTKFDHAYKDYFSKQIADFCVDAVQKK